MNPPIPATLDSPEAWRAFALAHVADTSTRRAVLAAMHAAPESARTEVLAAMLTHARGKARLDVAARIATLARAHPPSGPLVYALVGESLGSSGATREPCLEALAGAHADEQPGIALALAMAASMRGIRERDDRQRAAWDGFVARVPGDPLDGVAPDRAARAWRDDEPAPVALDHALLLTTAGAPRATVEHLRAFALHVVTRRGRATPPAARLLAWLARACTRPDAAPASVRHPAWFATAVDALACTAHTAVGASAALRHAADLLAGDRFDRALALAVVRQAVIDARRAPGESARALGDTLGALLEAVVRAPGGDTVPRDLLAVLLGRDRDGGLLGVARWLGDPLRARVLETALAHPALGARVVALDDLERLGVPPGVLHSLRDIAASDPDPITRQHARQLARGEHL
ncbi:MAG: hypothetical protein WCJ30_10065 [Deltaproteobacteria bacterium]